MQQRVYEKKTHDIDDLGKRLMQTWLDFKQDVIDAAINQCADGGHFEHVLWNVWSFIWFIRTFYETVSVIWCI